MLVPPQIDRRQGSKKEYRNIALLQDRSDDMSDDELPPQKEDTSFAAELGRTVGGVSFIAVFFAIAGVLVWLLIRAS